MTESASRWAGDLLLLFNSALTPPRARAGAAWAAEFETPHSRLLISPPAPGWRGSPLTCWQEDDFSYWLTGELWGKRANSNPAEWPGHFALFVYDRSASQWHLWTNRCGTFHIYHAASPSGASLGTYLPSVASVTNKTLDVTGLAGFFSLGFFPADRTHYEDVRIIRPSTHLILDQRGGVASQERTWEWHHEPDPSLKFSDTVDQFAGIFHQVISEQVSSRRVAFPISGGLDSRSTIAALGSVEPAARPWSFSYGYTNNSPETHIAAKIARARSLPHTRYTIQPYLFDLLPLITDSVEGFQDITQCRQAYITGDLAARSDFVMAAHWGDVWLDDMGVSHHPGVDWLDKAVSKFDKGGGWLIENIIRGLSPGLDVAGYLRETLAAEARALSSLADPDFRLKALKTETWSFRWTTASVRMYQPGAYPLLPFYDPRLVDFFCTIPTEYVAGRKLQIEYLKRYAPDLARVPWQKYDANLYWYPHYNDLLLPKRAFKKALRVLKRKPVIQRNWEVQFLTPGGRQALEDSLLDQSTKSLTIVPRAKAEELIREFYANPSASNGYSVSMLLTFAQWLEQHA